MTKILLTAAVATLFCAGLGYAQNPPHPRPEPRRGAAKTERQQRNADCRGMETRARELETQAKSLYEQAKATEQQRVNFIHEANQIEAKRVVLVREKRAAAEQEAKQEEGQRVALERQAQQAEEQRISFIHQADKMMKQRDALEGDRKASCGERR